MSGPFKMRSGNKSAFKMMGSSPVKDAGEHAHSDKESTAHPKLNWEERKKESDKTTVRKDYSNTVDKFSNFKGSKEELKKAVTANNKGKGASNKSRINPNVALKLWRKNNPIVPEEKIEVNNNEVKPKEGNFKQYGGEGSSDLNRNETYSDYAKELRGEGSGGVDGGLRKTT